MKFFAAIVALNLVAASTALGEPVRVEGASAFQPFMRSLADEYVASKKAQKRSAENNAPEIAVGLSGTRAALLKLCRGELDVALASRPILKGEMQVCAQAGVGYVELPVALDAITMIVNPRNPFLDNLTVEELRRIWQAEAQGKLIKWNQVNASWPDAPLTLFGPEANSGAPEYLAEALFGKITPLRRDYTTSADNSIIVRGVARDIYALGYVGYGDYAANRNTVRAVAIAGRTGDAPVAPTPINIQNGLYRQLTQPLVLYARAKSLDQTAVREFIEYTLQHAASAASEAHLIPLSEASYRAGLEQLRGRKTGSRFGGSIPIGLTPATLERSGTTP